MSETPKTPLGAEDLLTTAAQLATSSEERLKTFRQHLNNGDLESAAEELTWIGLEEGLRAPYWEKLAAACTRLGLAPEDPTSGGWVKIVHECVAANQDNT